MSFLPNPENPYLPGDVLLHLQTSARYVVLGVCGDWVTAMRLDSVSDSLFESWKSSSFRKDSDQRISFGPQNPEKAEKELRALALPFAIRALEEMGFTAGHARTILHGLSLRKLLREYRTHLEESNS